MSPRSGAISPTSLSYTPVRTSRMKLAPVARARARLALGSHRMLTPNGTRIGVCSSPLTAGRAVMTRPPGQAGEMHHRDHGLDGAESLLERHKHERPF